MILMIQRIKSINIIFTILFISKIILVSVCQDNYFWLIMIMIIIISVKYISSLKLFFIFFKYCTIFLYQQIKYRR